MGNVLGNLQAKKQAQSTADWTHVKKRSMKNFADPEGFIRVYQNLLAGMKQNYQPMLAGVGRSAGAGAATMNEGTSADLARRGYAGSPLAGAMKGATAAQGRATTAEALIRFYQQALQSAAQQAGSSGRSTIGAIGAFQPAGYQMPGAATAAAQGSDFLWGLAGKVGGAGAAGG